MQSINVAGNVSPSYEACFKSLVSFFEHMVHPWPIATSNSVKRCQSMTDGRFTCLELQPDLSKLPLQIQSVPISYNIWGWFDINTTRWVNTKVWKRSSQPTRWLREIFWGKGRGRSRAREGGEKESVTPWCAHSLGWVTGPRKRGG